MRPVLRGSRPFVTQGSLCLLVPTLFKLADWIIRAYKSKLKGFPGVALPSQHVQRVYEGFLGSQMHIQGGLQDTAAELDTQI